MHMTERVSVEGHVSTGFEPVREAFEENFERRHELAAAAMHAVYGTSMNRRVAGVARFRHAVATSSMRRWWCI